MVELLYRKFKLSVIAGMCFPLYNNNAAADNTEREGKV